MTRARAALVGAVVAGAACRSPAPEVERAAGSASLPALAPPGPRLPDALAPLAYDLTLALDPAAATFHGHVQIRARATRPTRAVWLHAVDLEIGAASARDAVGSAPLVAAGTGEEMRGYGLARPLAAGAEVTLELDYTGHIGTEEQGLFHERAGERWYLYAQSESVFARRILPCFDEPRWKPTWTVHLRVPAGAGAFGNAPEAARRTEPDGSLAIDLAPTPPMPSYLLSVAVGPFDVVPAGTVGRAQVPVRVIVPAGEGARAGVVARRLPPLALALEAYFDEPLPVGKLDLVAVPRFFGGMENPGLVTFASHLLLADPGDLPARRAFQRFAAHELAHLWLGDRVTPAWWDELWLAEAFATWLGDKVAGAQDGFDDAALRTAQARELAFDADELPDARPLRRPVVHGADADSTFDAIAYDKGAAVLAMLERWLGEAALRAALRRYVRAHADGTATSEDLVRAFADTPSAADVAAVLASYTAHAGVPVVDLDVRCGAVPPVVIARPRAPDLAVPVCVRYGVPSTSLATTPDTAVACAAVTRDRGEIPLPGALGCPPPLWGNADGAGYYTAQWSASATPAVAAWTAGEALARGRDVVDALARGELEPRAALGELERAARGGDAADAHVAIVIARALAPLVDDATAPRWERYLVARFAARLSASAIFEPGQTRDRIVRDELLELVPAAQLPAPTRRRALVELDRVLAGGLAAAREAPVEMLAAIAGAGDGRDRQPAVLALAATAEDPELRDALYEAAGSFGPHGIAPALAAVIAPDGGAAWPALRAYLERPATAVAAWAAVRGHASAVLAALDGEELVELVGAVSALCDAPAAADAARALEPALARLPDGRGALARARAVVERCAARRARGELAAALPF